MESTSTRKREFSQPVEKKDGLSMCEQLVILLRTRNEIKFLCNRVSLSLRACILAELALCGAIRLREGRVIGRDHIISNPLLAEGDEQDISRTASTRRADVQTQWREARRVHSNEERQDEDLQEPGGQVDMQNREQEHRVQQDHHKQLQCKDRNNKLHQRVFDRKQRNRLQSRDSDCLPDLLLLD
ncbi:hypothetical protein Bpfe_031400 [Biomphalaria pfeifferi]|uniref:Uncharacterized protein n=1 Tax=Biomphalaria pfeifferi TaxID=112525 RepID=A0AAD8EUF1_BIOPF|nr:hypothetical protein Bpfe_031400 [Biomphalaria pfeifferi]